ncbi:hypothetical protein X975_16628, partial [Stegodyphus mimosarum]
MNLTFVLVLFDVTLLFWIYFHLYLPAILVNTDNRLDIFQHCSSLFLFIYISIYPCSVKSTYLILMYVYYDYEYIIPTVLFIKYVAADLQVGITNALILLDIRRDLMNVTIHCEFGSAIRHLTLSSLFERH